MSVGPVARDERTADFLDGTAAGQFLLRKCDTCQSLLPPQARQCGHCGATRTAVIVIAELDEGPWWWSQVVDAARTPSRRGRACESTSRASEDSEYVPVFRLAT